MPLANSLSLALGGSNFSSKLAIISRRSLRNRILAYLHYMAARHGSASFSICMNREELASYLGVNRSALSHELSKMRAEGFVDYHKKQFTMIEEPDMQLISSCYSCSFCQEINEADSGGGAILLREADCSAKTS